MSEARSLLLLSMTVQAAVALTFALVFLGLWRGFHRQMAARWAVGWVVYAFGVAFSAWVIATDFGASFSPFARALLPLPLQIGVVLFRIGTDSLTKPEVSVRRYVPVVFVLTAMFLGFRQIESTGLVPVHPIFVTAMLPRLMMGLSYAWAAWPLLTGMRGRWAAGVALMAGALVCLSLRMLAAVAYEIWQIAHDAANRPESPLLNILQVGLLCLLGVAASLVLVEEERQQAIGAAQTIQETTDALHVAETRSQAVFDAAPNGLLLVDHNRRIRLVNTQIELLFGYGRADLLGEPIERLLPALVNEAPGDLATRSLEPSHFSWPTLGKDVVGLRRDGSEVPVEVALNVIDLKEGPFVIASVVDITERKRADDLLRQSEKALTAQLDLLPIPVAWADADDRMQYCNRQVTDRFGYHLSDIPTVAAFFEQAYPDPEYRATMAQTWLRQLAYARATEGTIGPIDVQFTCKDGTVRTVSVSGRIIGGRQVVVFDDLTERLALQAQLWQSQKMESLGRLAGGVAHDFNNLLTIINGYGDDVLSGLSDNDPIRPSIEAIHSAGWRAADLTRQLLTVSRTQVVDRRPIDVNDLIDANRGLFQRLVGEDIDLTLSLGASGQILADASQIHQVIMNLVVNAREAMPEGGRLSIATTNIDREEGHPHGMPGLGSGPHIRVTVSDTGLGIPLELQGRIFDPFFTTKRVGEGSGLGLSIVDSIVRQSGGHIAVSSPPDLGTTFTMHFPRVVGLVPDEPLGFPATLTPPRGIETVLVAEDEQLVRELVIDTLTGAGYRVLPAAQGEEAIAAAVRHGRSIDLLVTDVVMPQMTGPQLARALLLSRPDMRVLYMSGYSPTVTGDRQRIEIGPGYLAKPFTPTMLLRKVREILDAPVSSRVLVADDN